MASGILVTTYDTSDLELFANEGEEGLRKSVSPQEFSYYKKHSEDLGKVGSDLKNIIHSQSFTWSRNRPTFEVLQGAIKAGSACATILDASAGSDSHELDLHQILVLDAGKDVVFHDPYRGPEIRFSAEKFTNAWLKQVPNPSLTTCHRR